jgi:hypothetical protein
MLIIYYYVKINLTRVKLLFHKNTFEILINLFIQYRVLKL